MNKAKVKVNKEEFDALELYNNIEDGNLKERIQYYLTTSSTWSNSYKSLKNMGLEKFVRCFIFGYELELPTAPRYKSDKADISFNYSIRDMINKESHIKPDIVVYSRINQSISIEEAREIASALNDLCDYHVKYIQNNVKQID